MKSQPQALDIFLDIFSGVEFFTFLKSVCHEIKISGLLTCLFPDFLLPGPSNLKVAEDNL
jgi:hypothetical protein